MPDIINLLSDALANQIAAGEVVQRPASVVKELLENAVDAGSTSVTLIIKDAGKALIQVIDNGKGMSEIDTRMCFERHATSKIKATEDLFNIRTLGFRGEAMASIAAVAQVEIKSKQANEELGTLVKIEASEVKLHERTSATNGTNIQVKNLFFNVPARRNFLKSNPVEVKHILDEFQRVALANPEIAFAYYQGDLETANLASSKLSQRIVNMFGKSYQQQLITVDETTDLVRIKGYIGKPEAAKKTRGDQFFFVNNRFVKHHYLNYAVVDAYEGLLPDSTHPFYALFIEIEPKHVDINVHPTKTEVKFDDERTVHAILRASVKKALGIHNIIPTIDFEQDINFGVSTAGKRDYGSSQNAPFKVPPVKAFNPDAQRQENNGHHWEKLFSGFENERYQTPSNDLTEDNNDTENTTLNVESAINHRNTTEEIVGKNNEQQNENFFQLHDKYIATSVRSGLMLIDQQAAHERILYEKFMKKNSHNTGNIQQSLFPQSMQLSAPDFALVQELEDELHHIGFLFSFFSDNTVVINGVPADVQTSNEKHLFEGLLEQFKMNKSEIKLDKHENICRAMAKRASLSTARKMTKLEMSSLIGQLFACATPNYTPSGQPTFVLLDMENIHGQFRKN